MPTTEIPIRPANQATDGEFRETLVGAARQLGPLIRHNVTLGEQDRRLP